MLLNMNRKSWADNLKSKKAEPKRITDLMQKYCKMTSDEKKLSKEELEMKRVGKINYRKHLAEKCNEIIEEEDINNLLHSIHASIFH